MNRLLTRPSLIARAVSLAAAAVTVIVVILLLQGGPTYTLKLDMANANGIRPGSQVLLGGVSVGTVGSIDLGPHDRVIETLALDPKQIRIGRGATAHLLAANLLGEEYVALQPGNPAQPLPSGSTLPISAVTVPTDLDQIINVLDSDTQTALATLINEAGVAFAGRKRSVSAILRQIPLSVPLATNLLTQLVHDNHTLADVIASGNQLITRVDLQRSDLGHLIGSASGAARSAALRAGQLRQSLIAAPRALGTIQRLLVSAGATARALTRPAGEIAATAAPLDLVLREIGPFQRAAVPALNRAAAVAPLLTRLGEQATPTVRRAVPTLTAVSNTAKILQPLSYWLGADIGTGPGIDGVLGVIQGWAQAIQFRDGLGHEFQGQVNLDPSLIVKLANMGTTSAAAKRANRRAVQKIVERAKPTSPGPSIHVSPPAAPSNPVVSGITGGLHGVVTTLGGVMGALHGLLGSLSHGGGQPQNPSSPPPPPKNLAGLLGYLLGK
jgi:phospholipid/cholesterol/gamma-HCH transport system substrate-binding protein